MGKIITAVSQKGGVGQTATVLNLGYCLSRLGPKVLLIDANPQAGMSMASRLRKQTPAGLLELLKGQVRPKEVIVPAKDGNLDLLGAGALEAEEVIFFEKEALRRNLPEIIRSVTDPYDYVFVDAPTSLGVTSYALMSVSSGILVPLAPKALAVRSLGAVFKFLRRVRTRANRDLKLEGVLFTMVDMTSPEEVNLINEVRESFPRQVCMETVIPYDPAFEEANVRETPAAMLAEGENAARAYMDLAVEIRLKEMAQSREGAENGSIDGLF